MKKIFITTTALLIACTLSAADLFVSPEGNDRNPGTKDFPKATLTAALRQARELRRLNDPGKRYHPVYRCHHAR